MSSMQDYRSADIPPAPSVAVKKSRTAVIILAIVGIVIGLTVVLGILAVNAIPSFLGYQAKVRNAVAHAEIKNACIWASIVCTTSGCDGNCGRFRTEKRGAPNPDIELLIKNRTIQDLTIRASRIKGARYIRPIKIVPFRKQDFPEGEIIMFSIGLPEFIMIFFVRGMVAEMPISIILFGNAGGQYNRSQEFK
jgi:hypothetical protein